MATERSLPANYLLPPHVAVPALWRRKKGAFPRLRRCGLPDAAQSRAGRYTEPPRAGEPSKLSD